MTNSLAIVLGLCILGAIGADYYFFNADGLLFLGRKFFEFEEWIAFWR